MHLVYRTFTEKEQSMLLQYFQHENLEKIAARVIFVQFAVTFWT